MSDSTLHEMTEVQELARLRLKLSGYLPIYNGILEMLDEVEANLAECKERFPKEYDESAGEAVKQLRAQIMKNKSASS